MWIDYIILTLIGIGCGTAVAAGLFALISALTLIPRIANFSHTSEYVTTYEMVILAGGIAGNVATTLSFSWSLPTWVMGIFGLFGGIFIGCLAMSLAEALNVTAIFTRRLRLHTGIQWIILSMAIGKICGSLIYFIRGYNP